MLGGYIVLSQLHGLTQRELQHPFDPRREAEMAAGSVRVDLDDALDLLQQLFVCDVEIAQSLGGDAVFLPQQA